MYMYDDARFREFKVIPAWLYHQKN